jgi:hypothetical protein
MTESKSRVWKKITFLCLLTLLLSSIFEALAIRARGNVTLITGLMWCPALAALLTKWVFRESVRDLGWRWAYLIPLLYGLPVYLIVWLTGLGGFYDVTYAHSSAEDFGISWLPTPLRSARGAADAHR